MGVVMVGVLISPSNYSENCVLHWNYQMQHDPDQFHCLADLWQYVFCPESINKLQSRFLERVKRIFCGENFQE